jgi:hypothetical protein
MTPLAKRHPLQCLLDTDGRPLVVASVPVNTIAIWELSYMLGNRLRCSELHPCSGSSDSPRHLPVARTGLSLIARDKDVHVRFSVHLVEPAWCGPEDEGSSFAATGSGAEPRVPHRVF